MKHIIGVDEVGRGCLFGPVVSAAVAFVSDHIPDGLTDSKKLTPKKRDALFQLLTESSHKISIGSCSSQEVDELNILQASLLSMKKAVEGLGLPSNEILEVRVDGRFKIPNLEESIKQVPIIQGDLKDKAIAAASIIAKVYRDRLICSIEVNYPGYGLSSHKGYPTKVHKEALRKLGATDQHRKTFKGVSEVF